MECGVANSAGALLEMRFAGGVAIAEMEVGGLRSWRR